MGIGLIELGIGLIELGIGLIELGIGLIELGIGLIELVIGLVELWIGLMELGIGLRINNVRRTVLALVSGLFLPKMYRAYLYRLTVRQTDGWNDNRQIRFVILTCSDVQEKNIPAERRLTKGQSRSTTKDTFSSFLSPPPPQFSLYLYLHLLFFLLSFLT